MDHDDRVHLVSLSGVLRSSTSARIKGLKLLDAVAGRALMAGVRPSEPTATPIASGAIGRILVIRPGGIGDAVLAIPFLRELKRVFPAAALDVLAERRNCEIFSSLPGIVDRCDSVDEGPWRCRRRLRRASYDLVFDTEQWHHLSAFLAAVSGARIRVGFDTNRRRNRCYTVLVPYRHEDFEGESFLRMLSAVTGRQVRVNWDAPFLELQETHRRWAERQLPNERVVALALRGGIRERCWEPEKFQALIPRLLERELDVCLLGGRGDATLAAALRKPFPAARVVDLTGKTSLLQSAAVLSRSRLFIGTDAGLMHLAYAVGTPVVALFGAGIEAKWAPRGARHRVLNRHLPCSPCTQFGYTPRCPIGVRCLREISVDAVGQAALRQA